MKQLKTMAHKIVITSRYKERCCDVKSTILFIVSGSEKDKYKH
jgi:hypothetical protein